MTTLHDAPPLALTLRGYIPHAPELWRPHLAAAADAVEENARLRAERDEARALLRGYRKIVADLAPHFDKPITDENIVLWLNLNNAGARIDAALKDGEK